MASVDDNSSAPGPNSAQHFMRPHPSHLSSRSILPPGSSSPSSRASMGYGSSDLSSQWALDASSGTEQYSLDDSSGASMAYGSSNLGLPGSPIGASHHLHSGSMSPPPQILSRAGRNTTRTMLNLHQIQDADVQQTGASPLKSSTGSSGLGTSSITSGNMSSGTLSGLSNSGSVSNVPLHLSGSHTSGSSTSNASSSTLSSSGGAIPIGTGHQGRDITDSMLGHSGSSTGSGANSNSASRKGSPKRTSGPRTSRIGPPVGRAGGKDSGPGVVASGSTGSSSLSGGLDISNHDRRDLGGSGSLSASSGALSSNTLGGSKSLLKTSLGSDRSGIGSSSSTVVGNTSGVGNNAAIGGGALASAGGRKRSSGHASLLDAEAVASGVNDDGNLPGSATGMTGVVGLGNTVGGSNEMLSTASGNDSSVPRSVKRRKLAASASDSLSMHASGTTGASGGIGIGGSLSRGHSPAPSSVHLSSSTSAISSSHGSHMHQGHTPSSVGYPHRRGALSSSASADNRPGPESTISSQELMQLEMGFNTSLQHLGQSISSCMRKLLHHGVHTSHHNFLQERFAHASNTLYMLSEEFDSYASSVDMANGMPMSLPSSLQSPQQSGLSRTQSYASPSASGSMMLTNGLGSPQNVQSSASGGSSMPRSLFLPEHSLLSSSHSRTLVQQPHVPLHQQQQQQQTQHLQGSSYDVSSMPMKNAGWPTSSPYGDLYNHPPPHSYFVPPHLFNSGSADLSGTLNMSPDVDSYIPGNSLVHSFQPPSVIPTHSHYHNSSYSSQQAPSASPIMAGNASNTSQSQSSQGSQQGSSSQSNTSSSTNPQSQPNQAKQGQRDSQGQQSASNAGAATSAPSASQSPAPSGSGVQVSQQQSSSSTTQSSSTSSSQHGHHYDFSGTNAAFQFPSPTHPSYGSKASSSGSGSSVATGSSAAAGGNTSAAAGSYFSSSTSTTSATDSSSSEAFATYVYHPNDPSGGMHYTGFSSPFGHLHHHSHGHNEQPSPSSHSMSPHPMDDYHIKKQQPPQYY